MTTHPANQAFHAVQAIQTSVRAPEPSYDEIIAELEDHIAEAEYRLELANHRSDPFMRQRELDRWSLRISHINAQIKLVRGAEL